MNTQEKKAVRKLIIACEEVLANVADAEADTDLETNKMFSDYTTMYRNTLIVKSILVDYTEPD